MNTKRFTPVVFSTAMMFCALHCAGQSNVVYYGANSNALDVVFVDTTLSSSAKSNIVADLNLCLREWGKTADLRLRNNEGFAGYLYNWKTCPHYPDINSHGAPEGMEFPNDVVTNGTSGVALQVPKKLSDAYTNAFAFAAANSNVVAAAYAFVETVSSSNFAQTVTGDTAHNYILIENAPAEYYKEEFADVVELFETMKYHKPSVLGFYHNSKGPAATNLFVILPSEMKSGTQKLSSYLPAIWHEGRWKVCYWGLDP